MNFFIPRQDPKMRWEKIVSPELAKQIRSMKYKRPGKITPLKNKTATNTTNTNFTISATTTGRKIYIYIYI